MGALAVDTVVGAFGGILLTVGISILCDSLVEAYRRYRYNRQCVVVMPLKSKGRPYTAGINGHRGMIYGEPGGALDKIFEGPFFQLVDGLLFDDNKNPQLRNHLNTQNSFLTNI
jgi:hypothetical protein